MSNELTNPTNIHTLNIFYDFERLIKYDDLDTYQQSMLNVFRQNEYNENITNTITELFNYFKHFNQIKEIMNCVNKDNPIVTYSNHEMSFIILWSFEYFSKTHELLNDYYINNIFNQQLVDELKQLINNNINNNNNNNNK